MAPAHPAPTKRARLTLSQLASYDDILTDALVDHVYYWTIIRKNRSKYSLARGFSEDQITDILRDNLIVERDAQTTEQRLLQLPGIRRFIDRLKSKKEQEDFKRHLRKYINIWSNDCPFEISTTNRYTIISHEAAVIARRNIQKGEIVKYLCGNLVSMTAEEETDLGLTRRDFSIVMSSRKKAPSLFLGPARFANHDCRANARLVTTGSDGMQVVAQRTIYTNEEITVTYGEDYFGVDNCECLCRSCELAGRNGWAKLSVPALITPTLQEDEFQAFPRRSGRRQSSSGTSTPRLSTPEIESGRITKRRLSESMNVRRKRSKLCLEVPNEPRNDEETTTSDFNIHDPERQSLKPGSEVDQKVEENSLETKESPKGDFSLHKQANDSAEATCEDLQTPAPSGGVPQTSRPDLAWGLLAQETSSPLHKLESAQISVEPSDVESIFEHPPTGKSPLSPEHTPPSLGLHNCLTSSEQSAASDERLEAVYGVLQADDTLPSEINGSPEQELPAKPQSDCGVDQKPTLLLNDTDTSLLLDETPDTTLDAAEPPPSTPLALADISIEQRTAGDYTRTAILLAAPYSRWVDCRTCSATWVQADGYTTRRECPRCERHSKLYGYQWPKTERGQLSWVGGQPMGPTKPGKKRSQKIDEEREERVLDHRTVHRFIDASQERIEHRKGRGINPPSEEILAALAACEAENVETSEDEAPPPKRGAKNARGKKGKSMKGSKVSRDAVKKPSLMSKGRKLLKAASKLHAKGSRKITSELARAVGKKRGRPPGIKSKAMAGKGVNKRKLYDIFDYPSDSEEEMARPAKKGRGSKDQAKAPKKTERSAPKGWAWVPVVEPKPKPKPKEKPKPGWRGWVELAEGQSRPQTVEEAMAYPTATGTRRGTQLGRLDRDVLQNGPTRKRKKAAMSEEQTDMNGEETATVPETLHTEAREVSMMDDGDVDLIGVGEGDHSDNGPAEGALQAGEAVDPTPLVATD